MKRILIIQTAYIGDVVISTALVRELKKNYPKASIDILTTPISSILFKHCPHINRVLTFDKKKNKLINFFKLVNKIRNSKYDSAISIQTSLTSALLILLAGIKKRVGFENQPFLTQAISFQEKDNIHRRKRILKLLDAFEVKKGINDSTELFLSKKEENKADKLLNKKSVNDSFRFIGIAPGSVRITKKWPESHFIELVKLFKRNDIIPVFIGSNAEREVCESIIIKSGNSKSLNLAGELDLLESAAVIKQLDLIFVNDSAPLHIANAVNTTVFAFFGPTVQAYGFFPFGQNDKIFEKTLECRPCSLHGNKACPLKHHNCMNQINPQDVYRTLTDYLEGLKL